MSQFASRVALVIQALSSYGPAVLAVIEKLLNLLENPLVAGLIPARLAPYVDVIKTALHILQQLGPDAAKDLPAAIQALESIDLPALAAIPENPSA